MKRILMAIMAVAVAVTFSAPAFAEEKKDRGRRKQDLEDKPKIRQEEQKGGYSDTFGDEKKDEKKKDEKGK